MNIKHWLQRKLPTTHDIQQHPCLKIFGKITRSPNYWHMNSGSVARAFACGLFAAFVPLPVQMAFAIGLGIVFRANLFIAAALAWITNPVTTPPILYFCYYVGRRVLHLPPHPFKVELSWHWLHDTLTVLWKPLLLGSLICSICAAILGYVGVKIVYHFLPRKS